MNTPAFVLGPGSRGRRLSILGHFITPLATADQTWGCEILLIEGPKRAGPGSHRHPWSEALFVTRGAVHLTVDRETVLAAAGTLVHLPGGSAHGFRFADGGGEMLCITSRPGASRMFAEVDRAMSPPHPDRERLLAILARHGLTAAD